MHMASCLLVVVDSVEGAAPAHALALALVEAALHAFLTDLTAELLRFVNPASDAEGDAFLEPNGAGPSLPRIAFRLLALHTPIVSGLTGVCLPVSYTHLTLPTKRIV